MRDAQKKWHVNTRKNDVLEECRSRHGKCPYLDLPSPEAALEMFELRFGRSAVDTITKRPVEQPSCQVEQPHTELEPVPDVEERPPSIYQDVAIEELREYFRTATDLDYAAGVNLLRLEPQDKECIQFLFDRYPENGIPNLGIMMLADDAYTECYGGPVGHDVARKLNDSFFAKFDENELANFPEKFQARQFERVGNPESLRLMFQNRWDVSPLCEVAYMNSVADTGIRIGNWPPGARYDALTRLGETCVTPVTALALFGSAIYEDPDTEVFKKGLEGIDYGERLLLRWQDRFGERLSQYVMPYVSGTGYYPLRVDSNDLHWRAYSDAPPIVSYMPQEAVDVVSLSCNATKASFGANGNSHALKGALLSNKHVDEPRRLFRMLELAGPNFDNPEMAWFFNAPMKSHRQMLAKSFDVTDYPGAFEYYDPAKMREFGLDEKDIQLAKAFIFPQGLGGANNSGRVLGDMRDPNRLVQQF